MTTKEIWRDIPGFWGYYEASNLGRIRLAEIVIANGYGIPTKKPPVLLEPILDTKELYVMLEKRGKQSRHRVADLIAKTFITFPPRDYTVAHISKDRTDNRAENLKWVERELSQEQRRDIARRYYDGGMGVATLAKMFNVSKETVEGVVEERAKVKGKKVRIMEGLGSHEYPKR